MGALDALRLVAGSAVDLPSRAILFQVVLDGVPLGSGRWAWVGSLPALATRARVSLATVKRQVKVLGLAGVVTACEVGGQNARGFDFNVIGSLRADTGSHGADTGSHRTDTGSRGAETGSHGTDPGSHRADPGSHGTDPGSHRADPGSYGAGSYGADPGSQRADLGSHRADPVCGTPPATRGRDSLSEQIQDRERDVLGESEGVRERARTSAPPARASAAPSPAALTPPPTRDPLGPGALRSFDDSWCRITGHLVAKPAATDMLLACLREFGDLVLTEALVRLETWANDNPGRQVNPIWVRERCQQVVADRQRQSNPPRGQQRFAAGRRRADPIPSRESWDDPVVRAGHEKLRAEQAAWLGPVADDDEPFIWDDGVLPIGTPKDGSKP